MKIGLVFSWINYRCLKVDPQTARFLKVAVLALIRRLNKDIPVNSLLYQSKTCKNCRCEIFPQTHVKEFFYCSSYHWELLPTVCYLICGTFLNKKVDLINIRAYIQCTYLLNYGISYTITFNSWNVFLLIHYHM